MTHPHDDGGEELVGFWLEQPMQMVLPLRSLIEAMVYGSDGRRPRRDCKREEVFAFMRIYEDFLIENIEWDAKLAKRLGLRGVKVIDVGNAKRLQFFATQNQADRFDEELFRGPPENRNWPGDCGYDPSKPIGAWCFTGGPPADYFR